MSRHVPTAAVAALLISACQTGGVVESPQPPAPAQPAPPPATGSILPAGTDLLVTLNDTLSTAESDVGDLFTVTVRRPIIATNGDIVVPDNAVITGMITGLDDSDHPGDQAAIRLNFLRIDIDGVSHPLSADVLDTELVLEGDDEDRTERAAIIGGAVGVVIGAVIGGDLKDALIAGALGAGAGTIISLGMGGDVEAVLPEGTSMVIRTRDLIQLER